jgi:hypothetical protein
LFKDQNVRAKRKKKTKMGRPLFSQTYTTAPIVRTEPEPSVSPYQKWTYWNPFDPDSDEFLENDPVYEAFIVLPSSPDLEPQRDIVLVPDASDSSPSPEGSVGDRRSPMAEGSDDPIQMFSDALPDNMNDYWGPTVARPPMSGFRSFDLRSYRQRSATITVFPPQPPTPPPQNTSDSLPRTSNITPIPIPPRPAISTTPQSGFSPSTPPPQMISPSPPPSTSPRILTWTRGPPSSPSPPHPSGPLTNPNARMSLTHITPIVIRVRDVVI